MKLKVISSSSNGNCYLLQTEKETLIIECGVPDKEIMKSLKFNLSGVVGAIITHSHLDHSVSAGKLAERGINIFLTEPTAKSLNLKGHRIKIIEPLKQFNVGNFTILPFDTRHDCDGSVGFLIYEKSLKITTFFATDTYYIPYNFKDYEIHHVMIECNYSKEILRYNNQLEKLKDRIMHSHFELEDVKEFFRANDFTELRDVILLHLSNANSNAEQFTEEIKTLTKRPVYVAEKGLEVDFDLYKF